MRIDTNISSLTFVYPVLFDPSLFPHLIQAADAARWKMKNEDLYIWQEHTYPADELQPFVNEFLNRQAGGPTSSVTWNLSNDALVSPRCLGASAQWSLQTPQGELPFEMLACQLILFHIGVGFLSLRVRVQAGNDEPRLWFALLHYFRFFKGQRSTHLSARRNTGIDADRHPVLAPFFPPLAGGLEAHPDGSGITMDLVEGLLFTVAPPGLKRWWREVFITGTSLPYACLYVDDVHKQEIPYLVYRARNFFHFSQEITPSAEDEALADPALIPYARSQFFFCSLDGGGFLAANAVQTDFFRKLLPVHIREQYYLLFLIALQQRFALVMLEEHIAHHWLTPGAASDDLERREQAFKHIRDQMLAFKARGYFVQVMQREHHHRFYRKWQEVFQLEELYQEVRDEVTYMHSYLENEYSKQVQINDQARQKQIESLQQNVALLALLIGLPAIALAFLDAIGNTNVVLAVRVTLASFIATGALYLLLWLRNRSLL